ncbi:MAG: KH domain-containing protein [Nitrospinota bacterium]
MKELIETIVKSIVDSPNDVDVKEVVGDKTTVIELRVAKSDIGKVIGKQGRTAKSIRTLLSATAMKQNKRAVLEILE